MCGKVAFYGKARDFFIDLTHIFVTRHLLTPFELVLSGSDWHRHCWNAVRHAVSPHYQWHNTKGRCAFFSSTCQMSLKVNYAWLVFANCLMNYHEPQPNYSMYIYIVLFDMHERSIKKKREILDGHLWPPTASVKSVCLPLTCSGQPHLCVPAVCILPLTYIILIIIKPPQNARKHPWPCLSPTGPNVITWTLLCLWRCPYMFMYLYIYKCTVWHYVCVCVHLHLVTSLLVTWSHPSCLSLTHRIYLQYPHPPPPHPPQALSLTRQINCWHH